MIELEKCGIPTVAWTLASFEDDNKMSAKVFGSEGVALALSSSLRIFKNTE